MRIVRMRVAATSLNAKWSHGDSHVCIGKCEGKCEPAERGFCRAPLQHTSKMTVLTNNQSWAGVDGRSIPNGEESLPQRCIAVFRTVATRVCHDMDGVISRSVPVCSSVELAYIMPARHLLITLRHNRRRSSLLHHGCPIEDAPTGWEPPRVKAFR